MKRQLNTVDQSIRRVMERTATPRIRRGFVVGTYPGSAYGGARMVMVSLSDPTSGSRGLTVRARAQAGLSTSTVTDGTPVTIQIKHGQAEILSVG
jgi:hypothetical protein